MRINRRSFLAQGASFAAWTFVREARASAESVMAEALAEAQAQIDSGLIRGAVIAGGNLETVGAVGTQCVSPTRIALSANTRFDMASVTKTMTSAACSLLVSDGLLDVDAPFTRYLPEHALGSSCTITARDLLQHVGGFSNEKPYQVADMSVFWRRLMSKMPVRERRKTYEYACYNYILLGKIVERLTGRGLQTFCAERIFRPLGMSKTCWGPVADDGLVAQVPWATRTGAISDETANFCTFPVGNAGLFSNVGDLMLFVDDILMRRRFPASHYNRLYTCGWDDGTNRRAFGWDMSAGTRPPGLSDKAISHTGYTGQTICVDPETGFKGVVLTVRTGDHGAAIQGRRRILGKMAASI